MHTCFQPPARLHSGYHRIPAMSVSDLHSEPGQAEDNENGVATSQEQMVQVGESNSVVWQLKGWSEYHQFLKTNATCTIEVETGSGGMRKLRFRMEDFVRQVGNGQWKKWYSLWVGVCEGSEETEKVTLNLMVQVVEVEEDEEDDEEDEDTDEDDDEEDIDVKTQVTLGDENESEVIVKEEFMLMSVWNEDSGEKGRQNSSWAEVDQLKLKITVSVFKYQGSDVMDDKDLDENDACLRNISEGPPLVRDIKSMYGCEKNYSDVSLETRDGVILPAHKFILAARSPYFRGVIEREVNKKSGFSGLIKMPNVDGKPMSVVLHWMYTDELDKEQLSKVMDEVVKISVRWELTDLLQLLDKQLIGVCTTKNMLHLFQVAHRSGLVTATQDISEYIKENIDSVVPTTVAMRKLD